MVSPPKLSEKEVRAMTVKQLKKALSVRRLPQKGLKADLVARLLEKIRGEAESVENGNVLADLPRTASEVENGSTITDSQTTDLKRKVESKTLLSRNVEFQETESENNSANNRLAQSEGKRQEQKQENPNDSLINSGSREEDAITKDLTASVPKNGTLEEEEFDLNRFSFENKSLIIGIIREINVGCSRQLVFSEFWTTVLASLPEKFDDNQLERLFESDQTTLEALKRKEPSTCFSIIFDSVLVIFKRDYEAFKADSMKGLSQRISHQLSFEERISLVRFLVNCTNRLDISYVKNRVLSIASLSAWHFLPRSKLENEFRSMPPLRTHFEKGKVPMKGKLYRSSIFMILLIDSVIAFELQDQKSVQISTDARLKTYEFTATVCELLLDMLGQLYTRRFFQMVVQSSNFCAGLRMLCEKTLTMSSMDSISNSLTASCVRVLGMIDRISELLVFGVNAHNGRVVSAEKQLQHQQAKVELCQRVAFRHFEGSLGIFAFSSVVKAVEMTSSVEAAVVTFSDVSNAELFQFCSLIGLVSNREAESNSESIEFLALSLIENERLFLIHSIVEFLGTKVSRYCEVEKFGFYSRTKYAPIVSNVGSIEYRDLFQFQSLPLSKRSLSYLTVTDYQQRLRRCNFLKLTEAVSTSVFDSVSRILAKGYSWSRMAVSVLRSDIVKVENATNIDRSDDIIAQKVVGEIEFSLKNSPLGVRREWDELEDGEPLYLVSAVKNGDDTYEVLDVRGCFVEKKVMRIPPEGKENRCVRVIFDPLQYGEDITSNRRDIYSDFTIMIRCNSDVAYLHKLERSLDQAITSRSAGVDLLIPQWLRDTLTGNNTYGVNDESKMTQNRSEISEYIESSRFCLVSMPSGSNLDVQVAEKTVKLLQNRSGERIVIVTKSKESLTRTVNHLCSVEDIDRGRLVVLGSGQTRTNDNQTDVEGIFSKHSQVQYLLARRNQLLEEVGRLAQAVNAENVSMGEINFTCESAEQFYHYTLSPVLKAYQESNPEEPKPFPLARHFNLPPETLNDKGGKEVAEKYIKMVESLFSEISTLRPLELVRSSSQRAKFVLYNHSKIVVATQNSVLDNVTVLESLQASCIVYLEATKMNPIELFIPIITASHHLKKVVLVGDVTTEIPPPTTSTCSIGNNYEMSTLSECTRFMRTGTEPFVMKESVSSVLSYLPMKSSQFVVNSSTCPTLFVLESETENGKPDYRNAGFQSNWQCVNVDAYEGVGEMEPIPFVFTNLGEAEYVVSVYQYMILLGYNSNDISVMTPYNGQKHLIIDIMRHRCFELGLPMPGRIDTFCSGQGHRNKYILVSLVRTESLDSYIADGRQIRLIGSLAEKGLYIFGRKECFLKNSYSTAWKSVWSSSSAFDLGLYLGERYPVGDPSINNQTDMEKDKCYSVGSTDEMLSIVSTLLGQVT